MKEKSKSNVETFFNCIYVEKEKKQKKKQKHAAIFYSSYSQGPE